MSTAAGGPSPGTPLLTGSAQLLTRHESLAAPHVALLADLVVAPRQSTGRPVPDADLVDDVCTSPAVPQGAAVLAKVAAVLGSTCRSIIA